MQLYATADRVCNHVRQRIECAIICDSGQSVQHLLPNLSCLCEAYPLRRQRAMRGVSSGVKEMQGISNRGREIWVVPRRKIPAKQKSW
jgi:hypothetical protein